MTANDNVHDGVSARALGNSALSHGVLSNSGLSNNALGHGAEFDVIRALMSEWGELAEGIGDDAALLTVPAGYTLVVSTDATVEDVHFKRAWLSAREIGSRATTAALSDLAAMGATPHALLVSFIVPDPWRNDLNAVAAGIGDVVKTVGAKIVGGNISRGANFSCTLTVLGHVLKAVTRAQAAVGDTLCVTGVLGGPLTALEAWQSGHEPNAWARERFVSPVARIAHGQWLAACGATAMIDVSDGLISDAGHLAAASGVSCVLLPAQVPRFPLVTAADALRSGEEYELLVTMPAERAAQVATAFLAHFGLPLTAIGYVAERHTDSLVRLDGTLDNATDSSARVELPVGHDHFSGR